MELPCCKREHAVALEMSLLEHEDRTPLVTLNSKLIVLEEVEERERWELKPLRQHHSRRDQKVSNSAKQMPVTRKKKKKKHVEPLKTKETQCVTSSQAPSTSGTPLPFCARFCMYTNTSATMW
ncbi:hypothetical protein TRVL_04564 [Trypanosoma vivax]|nr:hypothetical protein TRVL_04564 [Trypanosoma vivax]